MHMILYSYPDTSCKCSHHHSSSFVTRRPVSRDAPIQNSVTATLSAELEASIWIPSTTLSWPLSWIGWRSLTLPPITILSLSLVRAWLRRWSSKLDTHFRRPSGGSRHNGRALHGSHRGSCRYRCWHLFFFLRLVRLWRM